MDVAHAVPRSAASHDDLAVLDLSCVVCGADTAEVDSCCSLRCAETAQRELHDNAGRLRRLPRHSELADVRRELAERNGRLSSALMRWRPSARRHHRVS